MSEHALENGATTQAFDANLQALADNVAKQTKAIVEYLQLNKHPKPTFAADAVGRPETPEYAKLYSSLRQTMENLDYLVKGPKGHFRELCCQGYELAATQVALDFNFFSIVPAEGQISLAELAQKAGVDLDRTSRIVRLLATEFIFREPTPGHVAHSPSSFLLHSDEEIRSTVHYTVDEMLKAASSTADNVRESPLDYDSAHTAFATRHGLPIFDFYSKDTKRSVRFAKAMAGWSKLNLNYNALKDSFPWQNLEGTVVDVGGGSGKVSITLAQEFPHLKFIVQDSTDMQAAGQSLLTPALLPRISFTQHSFFEPQPVHNAAAFMLRACALNWCDKDVITMFRALVPGLEHSAPDTPLLINDLVMPARESMARGHERGLRQIDLIMLVSFGGKLRTVEEFERLLKAADGRYDVASSSFEGLMGLLVVYLRQ